jgi:hypothetical protein
VRVAAEGEGAWWLFRDGEGYYLSVLCGTVALYSRDFWLNDDEIARFLAEGDAAIDALARQVCGAPSMFADRHRSELMERPDAIEAIRAWRVQSPHE